MIVDGGATLGIGGEKMAAECVLPRRRTGHGWGGKGCDALDDDVAFESILDVAPRARRAGVALRSALAGLLRLYRDERDPARLSRSRAGLAQPGPPSHRNAAENVLQIIDSSLPLGIPMFLVVDVVLWNVVNEAEELKSRRARRQQIRFLHRVGL